MKQICFVEQVGDVLFIDNLSETWDDIAFLRRNPEVFQAALDLRNERAAELRRGAGTWSNIERAKPTHRRRWVTHFGDIDPQTGLRKTYEELSPASYADQMDYLKDKLDSEREIGLIDPPELIRRPTHPAQIAGREIGHRISKSDFDKGILANKYVHI